MTGAGYETIWDKALEGPSRTFCISLENGRMQGMCDGVESVRQAVWKCLATQRGEHLIYGPYYGLDRNALVQADPAQLQAAAEQAVRSALLRDPRVWSVDRVQALRQGDSLSLTVEVTTRFGTVQLTEEV
ncbi:MAG: DUF2634 domain-containing protein [Eubacteriales bacterium]|jgi:phage baseplate assembly protein W